MNDVTPDEQWKIIGQHRPFWGVMADPEYDTEMVAPAAIESFYAAGKRSLEITLQELRRFTGELPRPGIALDFGCGVGRLALAMTDYCQQVIGIDISPGMLAICRTQANLRAIENLALYESVDHALRDYPEFDWINSFVVFQHIEPERGYRILESLLERLRVDGMLSIHFGVYRTMSPSELAILAEAFQMWGGRNVVSLSGEGLRDYHDYTMYDYDMNIVFALLSKYGIHRWEALYTHFSGHHGINILGRKEHSTINRCYHFGTWLSFSSTDDARGYDLISGWSTREDWGVWSLGEEAILNIRLFTAPSTATLTLVAEVRGFAPDQQRQRVLVRLGDITMATWKIDANTSQQIAALVLPAAFNAIILTLIFAPERPISPASLKQSDDARRLGIGLLRLKIEERKESAD